jgi:type IV secretory pathway VirB2 component (pilin)
MRILKDYMRIVKRPSGRKDGHARRWWLLAATTLLAAGSSAYAALISTNLPQIESIFEPIWVGFTGPIAWAESLVAIVVGAGMFAFSKEESKRTLGGIVFGVGLAIAGLNFCMPLFP